MITFECQVEFDGLTGKVQFDDNGFRDDFKIHLFEITMNMGLAEVSKSTNVYAFQPSKVH